MYKLIKNPISREIKLVLRISNNADIFFDTDDTGHQAHITWLALGNTPEPADNQPNP